MTTSEELSGSIARRVRPAYPGWMKAVCVGVIALQVAKVPTLNAFATSRAAGEPGVQGDLSDEIFRTSIYTGVGVALLFSAIIGCIAFYSVAKFLYHRAPDKARAFAGPQGGVLHAFAFALLWPDLWAVTGIIQPLVLPLFWVSHLALIGLIAWRTAGDRTLLKQYAVCVGISLFGVLL